MGPVEFSLRIFAFDPTLQQELQKLEADGWQIVPGLPPAVTYVVFRNAVQEATQAQPAPVQEPAREVAGFGTLGIDETKVHVYRNGRLVGEGNV